MDVGGLVIGGNKLDRSQEHNHGTQMAAKTQHLFVEEESKEQ